MKWSTKVLFTIVIVMIPFTCIWGASIQADGYGLTTDEAKINARNELAATIQTRVASKHTVMVSEYDYGKKSEKEELFFGDTSVTVSIELLGVEFSEPTRKGDGRTHITASLTEKSIPQYRSKLVLIKQNIESLEDRNKVVKDPLSQKQNLFLLLHYYEDFESYTLIVGTLDPEFEPPELTNTKAGVQLDILLLLTQERQDLQNELTEIVNPSLTSEAMQQQAQIRLAAIRQQLAQNQQEADLLQATHDQEQKALLELADLTITKSIESMNKSAQSIMKTLSQKKVNLNPQAMIQGIEEQKQAHTTIMKNLESEYNNQAAVIEQQYQKKITKLKNEDYRTAEKVNGIPTEDAKANRQQQIDILLKEKVTEMQSYRVKLEKSVQSQLNTLEKKIINDYKKLDATDFSLQSIKDEIQFKIGNYDGYRKSWPVAVRINVLETQFAFDLYIPYEKITGKSLPNFKFDNDSDKKAYDKYLDQVDLFEAFLLTTKDPLFIEAKYKVSPSNAASEYRIIPEQLQIKRADTGKRIFEISTSDLDRNIATYTFTPSTYLNLEYKSYYTKKIESLEANQLKQKEKKVKTKNRNVMLENRKLYYREGFYLGFGLASLPKSSSPINMDSYGISTYITGYYTLFNYLYVGASVDVTFTFYDKNKIPSSYSYGTTDDIKQSATMYGIFPLVGCSFPIKFDNGVLKPFIDFRFAMAEKFISVLNIGVHYTETSKVNLPLDVFLSLNIQMSGLNVGLWSISAGINLLDLIMIWF